MVAEIAERFARIVDWTEAREEAAHANPELTAIIDAIPAKKRPPFVLCGYLFGDLLVDKGCPFVSTPDGKLAPYDSADIDPKIRDQINYAAIPLLCTLNHANEAFSMAKNHTAPRDLSYAGNLLGIFEYTDARFNLPNDPPWNISAGARTLITLPKLTDSLGTKQLFQHFNLPSKTTMSTFANHWDVFRKMAAHPNFTQPWQQRCLVFGRKWLAGVKEKDPAFHELGHYLFEQCWMQAQNIFEIFRSQLHWESFFDTAHNYGIKLKYHLISEARQLLSILAARLPGMQPATDLETVAPIAGLQDALLKVYNLKSYLPTIMHPAPIKSLAKGAQLYYSLNFSLSVEPNIQQQNASYNTLEDLRDIRLFLEAFIEDREKPYREKLKNSLQDIELKYYHPVEDPRHNIISSQHIPEADPDFLLCYGTNPQHHFCAPSTFWRGCVNLKRKEPAIAE